MPFTVTLSDGQKHTVAKIEDLEISILSVDGKKKKSINKKDMIDQSAVDNVTIASDTRFLIYSVIEKEMPFVVKLNYSKISKETFTKNCIPHQVKIIIMNV